ncbi:hypothetical protein MBLNU459_g1196t1 [Dothideomycetes sp. NU459]
MSGQDYKPAIPGWQGHQERSAYSQGYTESGQLPHLQQTAPGPQRLAAQQIPHLRSYRTSPYPLTNQYQTQHSSGPSSYPQQGIEDVNLSQGHSNSIPGPVPEQQNYGGSVPGSPASRSPHSGGEEHEEGGDEDDVDACGEAEDEEGRPPLTAAELMKQKRKMKRFRLTHNQTRFLMSEFARQAHPDAGHRERLSREIPGLSPRQVQVWFQNRRAKLKRLTAEDRERMMKSRALPENFDMTPSLHSGFTGQGSGGGTPNTSPGTYGQVLHPGQMRPLTLDTLRRGVEIGPSYVSPTGLPSALGSMAFTPPQSATDTISPVSAGPDLSGFGFPPRPIMDSPRGGLYRGPHAPSGSYSGQYGQPARLTLHDRFQRPSGETASSPLRSSMSYGSLSTETPHRHDSGASIMSSGETSSFTPQQESQRNMPPPSGPYGLGFSYGTMANFPSSVRSPAQTSASGPPSVDLMQSYQRDNQQMLGQQSPSYPEYQNYHGTTPYSTPQAPQFPTFSAPYQPQSYSSSYVPRQDLPQPPVASGTMQGNQPAFAGRRRPDESEGESSGDGGMPMKTSY